MDARRLTAITNVLLVAVVGMAAGRLGVSLERVALNLNDTDKPDNAGRAPQGSRIATDGHGSEARSASVAPIRVHRCASVVPSLRRACGTNIMP